MHSDTPLDYAEFQLTPRRTRCELLVSAEGVKEKLASGFCKPFVSHLRVAEAQVARGSQAIRLEQHSKSSSRTGRPWFTKGTLERFVRFVSGPEVIERAKSIEDELAQLEQVRKALASTFAQTDNKYRNVDTAHSSNGPGFGRDGMPAMQRWDSAHADDTGPDTSKLDLLRAMDVRLTALRQEQKTAFSRAAAAGFDNDSISDLMTFAENFGAHRLSDACVQYMALLKRKTGIYEKHEEMDRLSAKANSNGFDVLSENDTRTRVELGTQSKMDVSLPLILQDSLQSESTTKMSNVFTCHDNQDDVSAREEICVTIKPTSRSILPQQASAVISASNQGHDYLDQKRMDHTWNPSESSHTCIEQTSRDVESTQIQHHEVKGLPANSPLPERFLTTSAQTAQNGSPHLEHSCSTITHGVNVALPKDNMRKEETLIKPVENERSKAKDKKEEEFVSTSVRRLSVQDAINLFESKKKTSAESPVKRSMKQESRRGSMEICSSPTFEKAVLKRWSGVHTPASGENCEQEKTAVLNRTEARDREEVGFDRNGANKDAVKEIKLVHDKDVRPVVDEQDMEKNKAPLGRVAANIIPRHQPEQTSSSTTPKVNAIFNEPLNMPSGAVQKQSEVQLMNSSTDEIQNTDAKSAIPAINSKVESRNAAMSSTKKLIQDQFGEPKIDSRSIVNGTILDIKIINEQYQREDRKGNFVHTASATVPNGPKLSTKVSIAKDDAGQKTVPCHKQEKLGLKESDIIKFKGLVDDGFQSASKISSKNLQSDKKQNQSEQYSDDRSAADSHMRALLMIADDRRHDSMNLSSEESPSQLQGRFYDHYDRLRDARLRQAPLAKKAERQAKLKSMQETLERRKAEMKEKAVVRPKKSLWIPQSQPGLQKLQTIKAGPKLAQREQDEQAAEEESNAWEDKSQVQDHLNGYSNPPSPASTPHLSNYQASSLKQQSVKKTASIPTKPSTASRTTTRTATAPLPRPNMKSSNGSPNQRKLPTTSQNNTMDNSDAKFAVNLKDSKKDIKKPLAGRMVSSAKVHPRINGNTQIENDLATNDSDTSGNADAQEDMKHRLCLVKENGTPVLHIKTSSPQLIDVVVLNSLGGQQEDVADLISNSGAMETAVNASVEGKSLLHENQGIVTGAIPGSRESKTSDGDVLADSIVHRDLVDSESQRRGNVFTKADVSMELGSSADNEISETSSILTMNISNNNASPPTHEDEAGYIEAETLACLAEDAFNSVRMDHSALCSGDLFKDKHTEPLVVDLISAAQDMFPAIEPQNQKDKAFSASLSPLLTGSNIVSMPKSNPTFTTSSAAIRVASLPHEHVTRPFFPAGPSLANASMSQLGTVSSHFSPPSNMALDSPLGSPASCTSTKLHYASEADLVRSRRQLNGLQKPVSAMTHAPKETAKGFKRLLHFGRKSRASEMAPTDCVSASTTSEGDDDAEETREPVSHYSNGPFRKTKMQEKGFETGNHGDHYGYHDQEALQFLSSSIPPPPANFKLREDHLARGTLLKAPRSFFSLSTFRNRGSESKSR